MRSDLPQPFRAVATNLMTGEEVIIIELSAWERFVTFSEMDLWI